MTAEETKSGQPVRCLGPWLPIYPHSDVCHLMWVYNQLCPHDMNAIRAADEARGRFAGGRETA
jgi:hypothetical protein